MDRCVAEVRPGPGCLPEAFGTHPGAVVLILAPAPDFPGRLVPWWRGPTPPESWDSWQGPRCCGWSGTSLGGSLARGEEGPFWLLTQESLVIAVA